MRVGPGKMRGDRIVDLRPDPAFREEGLKSVSVLRFDDVEIEHVRGAGTDLRLPHIGRPDAFVVHRREDDPFGVDVADMPEPDAQERGLDLVEAGVDALLVVDVLHAASVIPQRTNPFGDPFVARREGAGVAEGSQVLRREEAEAADRPERPRLHAVPQRPVALGAVLDDGESLPVRNSADPSHIAGLSVQVNRHDRFRPRRECVADVLGIEAVELVGLDEDGKGSVPRDCENRRDVGVRLDDDLVARADPERANREGEGVESRVEPDAMRDAEERRIFPLERGDFLPENVPARAQNPERGLLVFAGVRPKAGFERVEGNLPRRAAAVRHRSLPLFPSSCSRTRRTKSS